MTELETWLSRFKTVVHFVPQTSSQLQKALHYLPVSRDVNAIFVKTATSCTDLSEAEKVLTSYRVYNLSSVNDPSYFYAIAEQFSDDVLNAVRASCEQPVLINLSSAPKYIVLGLQQKALQKCDSSDAIHFAIINNTNRLVARFTLLGMLPPLPLPEIEEHTPNVENNTPSQPCAEQSRQEEADVAQTKPKQPSKSQAQQAQKDVKVTPASSTEPKLINHNDFQDEPLVVKRKAFVFHLWDYQQVILCGESGSVSPDTPSLKDVPIASVCSHSVSQPVTVKRTLNKRTVIVNQRKGFIHTFKGNNTDQKNYQFKDVLSDYPKIWKYIGGAWFEDYVYLILKENKSVQKLALRYKRTVAVPRFEIDVVAFSGGCYYLLSCKTGKPNSKDVTEHNELVKQLRLNGVNCKGILCYARDVDPPENLKDSEISCVCGSSLGEILKTKLTKLKPGVAYK
ncbi:MAG: hypothetical protein Q4G03_11615 [Planctomycetia bacterium]|nr:hypothetical protein [Planctomycetia bacterium]